MSLIFILFPIVVLALASGLGVGTVIFFCAPASDTKGGSKLPAWLRDLDRFSMALTLAIGVTVVAVAAVLLPQSAEFKKLYGEFLEYLWLWAVAAFFVGLIFGWGSCRQARER